MPLGKLFLHQVADLTPSAYVQHIPVLHDVVFAFDAENAFGAGVGFGAGFEQVVPAAR